jgi:phosphoribosyl 1,2-cyclic phosphate phosphodiesterase
MKATFLGTGTSQGVPVIACDCIVCQSADPRDNRTRTSFMIEFDNGFNVVIDTGPDFRQQMLREKVLDVNAVLFTHEHKDHVAGLDDIRAFNFKHKRDMDVYCEHRVHDALKVEFHYVFATTTYPGVPKMNVTEISNEPFLLNGQEIIPIKGMHYKLPVLGFRFGKLTYITDMNSISDEEFEKITGSDILIINALRKEDHISHFNLEQALEIIKKVNPKKAYLTHLSHHMGLHEEVEQELPENVFVGYDGLHIEL